MPFRWHPTLAVLLNPNRPRCEAKRAEPVNFFVCVGFMATGVATPGLFPRPRHANADGHALPTTAPISTTHKFRWQRKQRGLALPTL